MAFAMISTVMSGTPRTTSMKATDRKRTTGRRDRRPSASRMPSGSDSTIPTVETTTVTSRPPQSAVETFSSPQSTSTIASSTAKAAKAASVASPAERGSAPARAAPRAARTAATTAEAATSPQNRGGPLGRYSRKAAPTKARGATRTARTPRRIVRTMLDRRSIALASLAPNRPGGSFSPPAIGSDRTERPKSQAHPVRKVRNSAFPPVRSVKARAGISRKK